MKRTFFCNRHLALCALLWAQSLVGQTTGQYETADNEHDSIARRGVGTRLDSGARRGARLGAWPSAKPGEGAKPDTSAWLSEKLEAKPGDGARPSEGPRPGKGRKPGESARSFEQEALELMRVLTMINWPEWNDAQLDSAAEVWLQWWVGGGGGGPRRAKRRRS